MEQLIAGVGAGRRRRQKELESLLEEVLAEKAATEGVSMDTVRGAMNERLGSNKEHGPSMGPWAIAQITPNSDYIFFVFRHGFWCAARKIF